MDTSNSLSLPSTLPPRKPFKFFRNTKNKKIYDDRGLQILIKNYHKNLKHVEGKKYGSRAEKFDWPDDNYYQRQTLKYVIKIMRQNKSLSALKLSIYGYHPFHTCFLLPSLKNLRALTSFNVQYQYFLSMTPKVCRKLTRCLKNLKQLTNFDSNLYSILEMDQRFILKSLFQKIGKDSPLNVLGNMLFREFLYSFRNLTRLSFLSELSMKFYGADVLSDISLPLFSSYLARLPSLKSLSLELRECQGITKKGWICLSKSLSKLSLLNSLNLQILDSNSIQRLTFILFFKNLGSLAHFQELTLNLSQCSHLSVDCLVAGLTLLNPSSFRKLSLELDSRFCENSNLSNLFSVIQMFLQLTHLSLLFSLETQVLSQDFKSLTTTLSDLPCLVSLNLRINSTSFFEILSPCLVDLNKLTSLAIKTWVRSEDDNLGIQQFCSHLATLCTLEHLNLDFDIMDSGLENKWMRSVSGVFLDLLDIKSLDLRFYIEKRQILPFPIEEQEMFEDLILKIGFLKELKRLKLNFWNCFEMSTEMLAAFTVSLKALSCLNEVEISLRKPNIEEEIPEKYEHLIRALAGSETLTDICLKLPIFRESRDLRQLLQKVENGPKNFRF